MLASTTGTGSGAAARVNGWARFAPGLSAFASYQRKWLGADVAAALSVAAVAIPVGMAYAQLMGLPAVTGLYATIVPLVVYFIFGSSRQLIVGPDASTAALVAAALATVGATVGATEPAVRLGLAGMLAVLAGIAASLGGYLRLGFVANFLGKPILAGLMNGTALVIIMSQMGKLLGFSLHGDGFFRQVIELVMRLRETSLITLGVGVATFILLRAVPRLSPRLPGPLIAVAAAVATTAVLHLDQRGLAVLGSIPAGLPMPRLPSLGGVALTALVADALAIMLISYTGTILPARVFSAKNRYEIDANREMVAIGACNILTGFFQGYPVAGSMSRTAVNDLAGGKSRFVGLFAAACVAAVLMFLSGPLAYLPSAALAAILINAGLGILDLHTMRWLRKVAKLEFGLALITWLGVLTVGVLRGVLIAVLLAIIELLRRASRPRDAVLGYDAGRDDFYDVTRHEDLETAPGLLIYRFNAPILFFNADYFRDRVRAVISEAPDGVDWFILDGEMIGGIDATAAERLSDVLKELASRGVTFAIARPSAQVREMLEATGLDDEIGQEYLFANVRAGFDAFRQRPRESRGTE